MPKISSENQNANT